MKPVLLGYFVRRTSTAIMLLWLAISLLLVFFDFLQTAEDHPFFSALLLALLKSPQAAMEILPFACAIGSTITIRRMEQDGELPALRTSGLSPAMIAIFQIAAALPFVVLYILFSEVLLPQGADIHRTIQNKTSEIHGLWLKENSDYIHIQKIKSSDVMLSVVIYHTDSSGLAAVTRARRAIHQNSGWQLQEVEHIDFADKALSSRRQQQQEWNLSLQPSSFNAFTQKPREMSMTDAMRTAGELAAAGQHSNQLEKTIRRRWLMLPALLLLTCIGISFIGGARQKRYAISLPALLSTLIAGLYFIARDISIQVAAISDSALVLLLTPLLFAVYVMYSIRRAAMV